MASDITELDTTAKVRITALSSAVTLIGIKYLTAMHDVQEAQKLLKHNELKIFDVACLNIGEHISYIVPSSEFSLWNPSQHAVIENKGQYDDDKAFKLIFLTVSNGEFVVRSEITNLRQSCDNGTLFRHTYNDAVVYPAEQIVQRAKYLFENFRTTLPTLVPKLKDSETFATWCCTGMMHELLVESRIHVVKHKDLYVTTVKSLQDVEVGDQVSFKDGWFHSHHAVITGIDRQFPIPLQLQYLRHDANGQLVRQEQMSTDQKFYRYNYDISVRRRQHNDNQNLPPIARNFKDCEHFATTLAFGKEMPHLWAACLSKARMLGRLRYPILQFNDLEIGDHISWLKSSWFSSGYHHAIVTDLKDNSLTVIHFTENTGHKCHAVRQKIDVTIPTYVVTDVLKIIKDGHMLKYVYNKENCYEPEVVPERATSQQTPNAEKNFNNCEHFATWCKAEEENWDFVFHIQ